MSRLGSRVSRRRSALALIAVASLCGGVSARAGAPAVAKVKMPPMSGQGAPEAGIPAQLADLTPDSITEKTFSSIDFPEGADQEDGGVPGSTKWRVVSGTGNAAEVWFTINKAGRLYDLGGRYINYSDDRGKTWKSVKPLEPLANAEGSVVVAPNGDILGVTWDPYSGDRMLTYKYTFADSTWRYTYNPVKTPFWDRPGIDVVPGPVTTPLGTFPYITFINGLPHDPWYYSTDGLNYVTPSSMQVDSEMTAPIQSWLDAKPDPSNDWSQPHTYFPFAALGNGKALNASNYMFTPDDMKWHSFSLPTGTIPGTLQVDSRGWLHAVKRAGTGFIYSISTDGARSWKALTVTGGVPGDFRANAAAGVAAVWAEQGGKQDMVFKIDISTDEPRLIRQYKVGIGDDNRSGTLATYGLTGGHRYDFSAISIFDDGRVAVSFMDSTTRMKFPTVGQEVIAPAIAIEL
jgi:hypothetical protein